MVPNIGILYDDDSRSDDFSPDFEAEGAPTLQDEVRNAAAHIRRGQATCPDNFSIEMITALEDFGIEQFTILLNKIYETGNIPNDLLKSIFVALPFKKIWSYRM